MLGACFVREQQIDLGRIEHWVKLGRESRKVVLTGIEHLDDEFNHRLQCWLRRASALSKALTTFVSEAGGLAVSRNLLSGPSVMVAA